jgi:phenylpyruvate tautomerase PptA (4-oxalocrotonate tautomerase family)
MMPVYNCISPVGAVSMEAREEIATAITDVHCNSTGAPRSFVHVFFREAPGSGPSASGFDKSYYIDGFNRAGRPADVVLKLKEDLRKAFSDKAGVSLDQVGVRIAETPASWVMEGGDILPEPGDEDEKWYASEKT